MKNTEQKITDTYELVALASEAIVENGDALQAVDRNVNVVGKTVVDLHKTTQGVKDSIDNQTKAVNSIRENQEAVQETNSSLTDAINGALNVFHENTETLNTIGDTLKEQTETRDAAHNELIDVLAKNQEAYSADVNGLVDVVKDTQETIKVLDVNSTLEEIIQKLTTVNESNVALSKTTEAHTNALMSRLTDVNKTVETAIHEINQVSEFANAITNDFETAIARMGNIELKLDSINNQTIDDAVSEESFGDISELEELVDDHKENEGE